MSTTTEIAQPMLIGLTGHAGAGKDSVGMLLQAAGWHITSFAHALRMEVAEHWRIDPRQLTDRATKETPSASLCVGQVHYSTWLHFAAVQGHNMSTPRSPRWVLQQWGSFRRSQRPDYWIEHVQVWRRAILRHNPMACLAITDCRYENEAAALRAAGGYIVRVHRPAGAAQLAADTAQHASERHTLIRADADLHNDASLWELAAEVRRVVHALSNPTNSKATT